MHFQIVGYKVWGFELKYLVSQTIVEVCTSGGVLLFEFGCIAAFWPQHDLDLLIMIGKAMDYFGAMVASDAIL